MIIVGDNDFTPFQQDEKYLKLKVTLNLTSEDEHEPYVDIFIRTIKEKARLCLSLIPLTHLLKRLTVELVYCQLFWYNFLTPEDYISTNLGPGAIVIGRSYDYDKICGPGTMFGWCVQTYEHTSNIMRGRTVSTITFRPSDKDRLTTIALLLDNNYIVENTLHSQCPMN